MAYHRVLARQLRKFQSKGMTEENLIEFLSAISDTYAQYDKEMQITQRAMYLSSEELKEANEKAKREFQERTEKEQLLNRINENVSEAVFRVSEDYVFLFVNKAFVELFGFESEQEALDSMLPLIWKDSEKTLQLSEKLLTNGKIQGEEILCCKQDGTQFWGLMNLVSFVNAQGKKCYDGAIVNITTQKRQEEALMTMNKELDKLIYSIGHDLRAPISSALGLIELSADETDLETLRKYNEMKRKSLLRLDNFIQDTLYYARNARTDIHIERVNLEEEIKEMIESLYLSTEIPNIEVKTTFLGEKICYTDKNRLNIILNNLISNAFRYHDKHKAEKFISVDIEIHTDEILIQIADNGQGIKSEHINHIFELFYRANTQTKGTGLGLHIVQEAVKKLEGTISVQSEWGKGTIFAINIPNQKVHFLKKTGQVELLHT